MGVMDARYAVLCLMLAAIFSGVSLAEDAAGALGQEGIWVLDMGEKKVTMVVYQHDGLLAGACNGDYPDPWNAAMVGYVSGDEIELHTSRHEDEVIVETLMSGKTTGENINGSFVQSDSLGRVTSGKVSGFKINPDVSEYRPAVEITLAVAPIKEPATQATEETNPANSKADKSRFVDVTTQSDRVFYLGWAWKPGEPSTENGPSKINSSAVL
ncbi:MAG: hypothetical protein WBN94_06705 [Methanothrix sp.]